jgi:hypothetical protein
LKVRAQKDAIRVDAVASKLTDCIVRAVDVLANLVSSLRLFGAHVIVLPNVCG